MTFKTSNSLASHQAKIHQKERLSGPYVKDGNCPFCGALFHTRGSAMHHVDFGSKAYKARLLSSLGLPELTEDEIALARQQDRLDYAAAKARGVWRNAGPPANPPLEVGQGRKHNVLNGFFGRDFPVHFRGLTAILLRAGVRVFSSLSSHVPLALSVLRLSVICLCSFLPRHRRIPARPLVKTAPCFLMDSLGVVLREARSQQFAWASRILKCF